MLAYDGASAFDLAVAKQHGAILITGYLVGHPGGQNPITRERVAEIRSAGMGFLPNWERAADYLVTCGKAGGFGAGQEALTAMRALGLPDNGTVACAFSWDVSIAPDRYPLCGEVADGIISVLGAHYLFSAYAQGGLLDYFRATGRARVKGWLSGSASFPGFDVTSPNVGMVQSHDADGNWLATQVPGTDVNTVIDPHALGAWWPPGSPYLGDGSDMTPEQAADLAFVAHYLRESPGNKQTLNDALAYAGISGVKQTVVGQGDRVVSAVAAAGDPGKLAAALLPPLVAAVNTADEPITQAMLASAIVDALKQLATPAGAGQ